MKIFVMIIATVCCAAVSAFIDRYQGFSTTKEAALRGALAGLFVGGLLCIAAGARSRRKSALPGTDDSKPGNRPWFRFSLGAILWLVTVVCVCLGWVGCYWQMVRERQSCFNSITWSGEGPSYWAYPDSRPLPFPRNWLGDKRFSSISLHSDIDEKAFARIHEAHPEAKISFRSDRNLSWPIDVSRPISEQRTWQPVRQKRVPRPQEDLVTAREDFETELMRRGPAPQPHYVAQPPDGVQMVEYVSDDLKLKGWLSFPPTDKSKRPAVVFLHGGFALTPEDWTDAEPFVDAGFVLFMPALRGENGNPGFYESFFGEVNDAIAAGRYVASLPYVDSNRIFIAGHSTGAILTSLTAAMPSPYRAAAAFDGYFNMKDWVADTPRGDIPYDRSDSEEIRLRNPLEFASTLKIPIALYVGEARMVNEVFLARAQQGKKICKLKIVPGDHQTMVAPAVREAMTWFRSQVNE